MKEENVELIDEFLADTKSETDYSSNTLALESSIGIRPRPLICKPGNVNVTSCKSEPIESKRHWAPGAWQDATRTSAFIPYKPPTLLTNLQRGNTQTEIPQTYGSKKDTFYTLAGQGELSIDNIQSVSVKLDVPDENGLTALMWAVGYGQLNTAKLLLNAGANLNYKGTSGETSLHLAAAHGHHDLVKLLLSYGADPNLTDDDGNTPLIYGAQNDHPHVCYELLSRNAEVTLKNELGINAYQAAILKNAATAKAVIENYLVQKVVQFSSDIF